MGLATGPAAGLLPACAAAKILLSAVVSSTYTLFPPEAAALGLAPIARAEVLATFPVAYLVALAPAGWLCDHASWARLVLVAGVLGLSGASLAFGASGEVGGFVAARTALGLFSAASDVAASALVGAAAGENLAYAQGVLESAEALGWIVGPPVGALLFARVGFRAAFFAWAALGGVLASVLALQRPPVAPKESGYAALGGEEMGREAEEDQAAAPERSDAALAAALLLRGLPVLAYGAGSGAMYSGLALEISKENRALGVGAAASLQLLVAVTYLLFAPAVGRVSDTCGEGALRRGIAVGWAILAVGFAVLVEVGDWRRSAAALLLLGLGEACVLIPSYPLLTAASPDRPGLVAATFNGCWALGQGLGPVALALSSWGSAMGTAAASSAALACAYCVWSGAARDSS